MGWPSSTPTPLPPLLLNIHPNDFSMTPKLHETVTLFELTTLQAAPAAEENGTPLGPSLEAGGSGLTYGSTINWKTTSLFAGDSAQIAASGGSNSGRGGSQAAAGRGGSVVSALTRSAFRRASLEMQVPWQQPGSAAAAADARPPQYPAAKETIKPPPQGHASERQSPFTMAAEEEEEDGDVFLAPPPPPKGNWNVPRRASIEVATLHQRFTAAGASRTLEAVPFKPITRGVSLDAGLSRKEAVERAMSRLWMCGCEGGWGFVDVWEGKR